MIDIEEIESIRMTVTEYCKIHGKSTSWARKHLRLGNSLPYVLSAVKHERYNYWVLTVSSSIRLKTPLKYLFYHSTQK